MPCLVVPCAPATRVTPGTGVCKQPVSSAKSPQQHLQLCRRPTLHALDLGQGLSHLARCADAQAWHSCDARVQLLKQPAERLELSGGTSGCSSCCQAVSSFTHAHPDPISTSQMERPGWLEAQEQVALGASGQRASAACMRAA